MTREPLGEFWFSEFTSPSGNLHHFHLHLDEDGDSSMSLRKTRRDGSVVTAGFRVKCLRQGDWIVLAAADDSEGGNGKAAMILWLDESARRMEGRMMWNSSSGGNEENQEIVWTRETPVQER